MHAKNALQGKKEFVVAKQDIEKNIAAYTRNMGYLAATIGGELLKHGKNDEKKNILTWIWGGNHWQRHDDLSEKRVPNTGTWILRCPEFQDWQCNDGPRALICHGMRTLTLR